ncbi:glycosyltransferase, partial [bacterium]|nr:glycosyltransferase [bacterium]
MNLAASIIVVTYDSERWIENCLKALSDQSFDKEYEIVVVDNGSSDNTCNIIRNEFPTVKLIESENRGFGAGNNLGAKQAGGKYLAFINPDTIADSQWLVELLRPLENRGIVTTSKILLMEEPELVNTCGNVLHFT